MRVVRWSSLRDIRWEIIQFWGHLCLYHCARFLQWYRWNVPDNGRECSLWNPRLFLHQICEIPYLRYDYQFGSWDQYHLYRQHPRTNWVSLSQFYYQGTWILYNHRHSRYVFEFFHPWWCRYAKIINSFIIPQSIIRLIVKRPSLRLPKLKCPKNSLFAKYLFSKLNSLIIIIIMYGNQKCVISWVITKNVSFQCMTTKNASLQCMTTKNTLFQEW